MSGWNRDLNSFAARAGLRLETVVRKMIFELFSEVVRTSPVDTGRFRANWNVSYGRPDFTVTASTNKGRSKTEVQKVLSHPPGVSYLANALPYAIRLEYGWSKQAPYGMVRLGILKQRVFLQRALK